MITYKERVEIANEYRKWAKDNHVLDCAEAVIAFLEINRIIPGWTPCDMARPKQESDEQRRGWYLTTNDRGVVSLTCYEFYPDKYCKNGWRSDLDILAWMPLPKPYQEG